MKLIQCFALKAAAFVLAVLCLPLAVLGTLGGAMLADAGIYTATPGQLSQMVYPDMLAAVADDIARTSLNQSGGAAVAWPADESNLRWQVSVNGTVIDSSFGSEKHTYQYSADMELYYQASELRWLYDYLDDPAAISAALDCMQTLPGLQNYVKAGGILEELLPLPVSEDYTGSAYNGTHITPTLSVQLYLTEPLTANDSFAKIGQLITLACGVRDILIPLLVALYLVSLVCLIYLFCAAGRRAGCDGVSPNPLDKIPLDIYTVLCGGILTALLALAAFMLDNLSTVIELVVLAGSCLLAVAVLLGYILGIATRAKLGSMFRHSLIWVVLRFIGRCIRSCWRAARHMAAGIPLVWKALGCTAVVVLIDFLVTSSTSHYQEALVWWLARSCFTGLAVLVISLNLRQLQQGIRRMAKGDLDTPVDTRYLVGDFAASGKELAHIRTGMTRAVEEKMRSERLKTELITNVSHDIKTPLTSIINYVDLIKKEQPENEAVQEYIAVLDRQSTRLKKLIEDLIEASKASSGTLAVHPEACDLCVLLGQLIGEYSEKLEAASLTPVAELPERPIRVLADGRHIWRIFDNLMNNICKYAQAGTRVYLKLAEENGRAAVTFRNISREELNITGDELMERFVRGDRSRHTEGSGLGLSIARSLTELQGGTLELAVDGDLFKVTVSFPVTDTPAADPSGGTA